MPHRDPRTQASRGGRSSPPPSPRNGKQSGRSTPQRARASASPQRKASSAPPSRRASKGASKAERSDSTSRSRKLRGVERAAAQRAYEARARPYEARERRLVAAASRDTVRAVTQWTTGIAPKWTIEGVRAALKKHALGDFYDSARLVDSMGEDDNLPGLIDKRITRLLGEDFELRPVEEKGKRASGALVKRFEASWWDMFPEAELAELLKWYRMLGVGLGVLDWNLGERVWAPKLRTLHPQFLRYDQWQRKWFFRAREGELEVTPGDGKWVLLTDGQQGWMRGLVRPIAISWIAKQLTIRDWNRYNERHGLPIIKAFAPAIADDEDKENYWEDVKSLNSETTAQLVTHLDESGAQYDLELLEAKDQSWESFERMLDRCDRRFTVLILGANMNTEVGGQGTRAGAEQHADELRQLAHADGLKLSTELRWQGLWPVCAFNVASTDLAVIPWPHWATESEEDLTEAAKAVEMFGRGLRVLRLAGYDVENVDELAEKYGLKLIKRKEPEPALAPNTGGVPGDPNAPSPQPAPAAPAPLS